MVEQTSFCQGDLEQASDACSEGLLVIDRSFSIHYLNRAMAVLIGRAPSDCRGRTCAELLVPEWHEALHLLLERVLEGDQRAECAISWCTSPGVEVQLALSATPWLGADGHILGLIQVARDATLEREAQAHTKSLERQLLNAQRLEAIGRLASGVAHDFNNLLAVILNYSRFIKNALEPGCPSLQDILEIHKAALQGAQLTRQLLAFSRKENVSPVVLNLNRVVEEMDKMLRRMIGEDVTLEIRLMPGLDEVRVDPAQIEQAIINLAVNARDSMPQGGRLTIATRNVTVTKEEAAQQLDLQAGPHVALQVIDNGCGIPPHNVEHIFEPFFTTKPPGQGTGLGLSTVYGVAKQAGGSVQVDSHVGMGSTFTLLLPRHEGPAETSPAVSDESPEQARGETILVVEDEESVRRLTHRMLINLGYQVLVAGNALEALALAKEHAGAIDVLLTDVVMPGQSGRQLAEQLARIRPETRVVFMSGYSDDIMGRHGIDRHNLILLTKPFTKEHLGRALRRAIPDAQGAKSAASSS